MEEDWELSQQLISDSQGIRAACVLPPEADNQIDAFRIVTGNQGGGLCEFRVPSGAIHPIEYQHDHAVTALLSNSTIYATGCKDAMIRIMDASSHQCLATLKGHEKPVTSLAWASTTDGTEFLVSGSWDGSAKVWNLSTNAMIATLPGHENSVSVVGGIATAPNSLQIVTGSAGMALNNQISGHTVRIWDVDILTSQTKCLHTVANDHEGPIRDVAALPNCLVSCSNDGTVKLRTVDSGEAFSTLTFPNSSPQSHPPMLLSVVPLSDSILAASAEDGHVVVWSHLDGAASADPQILLHAQCVWNVLALPNGDVATCCQDGTLRIFTKSAERYAPASEREHFAQEVQASVQKQQTGPTQDEIAKLPLWESNLLKKGTSEGQVQIFNKGGVAIAAQWSMASQTWIEVGQVMGSSDSGTVDGVQYDLVLPIEIDQPGGGVAKLQCGYNNGENSFVAAQRFIDAYMLPQHHLSDIADYIQQRVGKESPTLGGGGAAAPTSKAAPAKATTGIPMISFQHLPMPAYKSFDLPAKTATVTLEKMKNKIQEFGKLSEGQLAQVTTLMETLGATNRYHASKVSPAELQVISDVLQTSPPAEAFPALDLAKLTAIHPDAASTSNGAVWNKILAQAFALCEQTEGLEGAAAVAIPMLSLRLFANAFRGGPGSQEAAASSLDSILACTTKFANSANKNVRLSVATVLYNVAFYMHSKTARVDVCIQIVTVVNSILGLKSYETEALTRVLIALGTVAMSCPEAKEAATSLYVVSRVEMAASPHGDLAKAIAKEVYNALT